MRVLVVDDLALIREGIRSALRDVSDIEIVGEAVSAEETVRMVRELQPHVVLLDLEMPDGDGLLIARQIKEAMPSVEVLVMTDRLDDGQALEAIEAGATGYLLKDIPRENLVRALRAVHNGRTYFHPDLSRKVLDHLCHLARQERTRQRHRASALTERELEVVRELASGATDAAIARKFVVTQGTIKTHVHNILRKLSCRNRTQAVVFLLRKGLIK